MVYVLLVIGIGLLILGVIRGREKTDTEFSRILEEIEGTDELRLVNHTIGEQELSDRLNEALIELANVKAAAARSERRLETIETRIAMQTKANELKKTSPEDYKDMSQKLDSLKKSKSIDQLSKEMEVGKGELQLLQKLQKK